MKPTISRAFGALALALAVSTAATSAQASRKAKRHVLVVTVTKGFRHSSIPTAEATIEKLGVQTGKWDTDFARTDEELAVKMRPEALKAYDAVIFANTTGVLPLPDPQAFLDYIHAGHGFAAMHSGSDTFHTWPGSSAAVSPYVQMLGGEFLTHHAQTTVDAHIVDSGHPATKPLAQAPKAATRGSDQEMQRHTEAAPGIFRAYDEIYLFKNVDRDHIHALLMLDKYPNDGSPDANKPGEQMISWCKSYGKGRVFYTELGHREEVWNDALYQAHITGGILWALGDVKGSSAPNLVPVRN